MKFPKRVGLLQPSSTFVFMSKAQELKKKGLNVIDLSVGEPELPTPENVKETGIKAIKENFTKYTATSGIIELKKVIAEDYSRKTGVKFETQEVIVTPGSKFGLFISALTLFEEGDEVIIPSPYWVTYPEQVRLCGATPVFVSIVEEDRRIEFRGEKLIPFINDKTKAIILNYPSNPSGSIIDEEGLKRLCELSMERNFYIIIDECYRDIIYEREFPEALRLCPEAKKNLLLIGSLSKSYSMTGWRVGYVLASKEIIENMEILQGHSTSNPCSISQKAAVEAISNSSEHLKNVREIYWKKRDMGLKLLAEIKNVKIYPPEGAFYFYPEISYYIGEKLKDSTELALYLIDSVQVVTVPGDSFGTPGFLRISFAVSEETLREGIERIKEALYKIRS
ncbi:MAG: pyridoxal phosphate-dependent aminotransferase [Candidatus Aminicenantia bacterium]